jgi:carboxymethylenebutenolidase
MGEFHEITSEAGTMRGYFALPEKPNGCGIVLGSSVWGINSDLKAVADGYAALGYAVVAPNLFWRLTPEDGMEYDFSRFDIVLKYADSGSDPEGLVDFRNAKAELVRRSGCKRIAVIGWCYGGRVACLAAMEEIFDLSIAMYPTFLEKHLYIADKLKHPLMLHLPEVERFGTVEDAVERMVHAFKDRPEVRTYLYPGVNHGFDFAPPHPYGDHAAARLCDNRVALCLDSILVRGEPV